MLPKYLVGKTLVNQGDLYIESSLLAMSAASVVNQIGTSVMINSSAILGDAQSTIENFGQITTSGDVTIQTRIQNFGAVQQIGSSSMTYLENTGGSVSIFGKTEIDMFNFTSGQLSVESNLTLGIFSWTSGSIVGPNPISISGDSSFLPSAYAKQSSAPLSFNTSLTLFSTSVSLSAPLTLNPNTTAYLRTSSIHSNSTLVNFGTLVGSEGRSELAVSNLSSSGGSLQVLPGATLATISGGGVVGGSVEVYGSAEFDGSAYNFEAGVSISGSGTILWQNSSQISFYGAFTENLSLIVASSSMVCSLRTFSHLTCSFVLILIQL